MNKQIILRDDEMPTQWYNAVSDIPNGLQPSLDLETTSEEEIAKSIANLPNI